jgi:cadmium resistance protein CadD (predicted permease)
MTAGLLGATLLITATTLDDAVWLVPYCASPTLPLSTRILHGTIFVLTLECLAILCVALSLFLEQAVIVSTSGNGSERDESLLFGAVGAFICWAISIGLYIKKLLKRRRRNELAAALSVLEGEETPLPLQSSPDSSDNDDDDEEEGKVISSTPSPWLIITLTTLGALDEISYFPALVVSNVFTASQLLWGTFLAAILILVIVLGFLAKCRPLVEFLDSIPLYGIVGMFAVVLTFGVMVDYNST